MPKFKLVISDPETGKSQSIELEGVKAQPLLGRRIGEVIDGSIAGLTGCKLQITGGSDKDGFPMRPNVHGGVRAAIVLSKGVGYHPQRKGERKRRLVRGDTITEEIVQINLLIKERVKQVQEAEVAEKPK
ncbi:30S ribosomal protein S6e [Candidatus Bathyarchaeota archaeon]|nr:30S ribosomal protein S6e [Candidatus Bathyarchaeota archaeon]